MQDAATRSSWKASPMPAQRTSLSLEMTFSRSEMQQIAAGCVPEQMEDKWFIFYEPPWLYLHRSWTGFCIYQVRIEPDSDRYRVAEAMANRDASQHHGQSAEQDALLLSILLYNQVGRDSGELWNRYTDRCGPKGRLSDGSKPPSLPTWLVLFLFTLLFIVAGIGLAKVAFLVQFIWSLRR
jgi:hypothetical protein